jgi:exopolyphosphatase/guanosine-5'-triphosphate,3'-diphosphate pyrophosphatase
MESKRDLRWIKGERFVPLRIYESPSRTVGFVARRSGRESGAMSTGAHATERRIGAVRFRRAPRFAFFSSMLLAAVDLGSNSFRLEIGRANDSHIEPRGYWKETVRLARGLGDDGRLSKKSIDAACECLARMNERLRGIDAEHVRAVGTQTLRDAVNVNEFLLEAQAALGHPIEVISGREEARLIFEGCMHALPPTSAPRLVVDIGGASTEVIVGRGFAADAAESFKIGCANTTQRFFRNGAIDRGSFKHAVVACAAELEEAIAQFSRRHWDEAYGTSGTIGAVAQILRSAGWSDGAITADGLLKLRQALLDFREVRRIRFAGLKPERQEVIAGGVAVLIAVFETLAITEMQLGRGGLRAGVLYDLLGRREHRDLRDATVERLQARFGVDRAQAERVARIAQPLHAALQARASEEERKRLAWAAALHEIGFAISHNDYHKHGAYLVEHGDLAGFSTTDQQHLATLVLSQRGNLKKVLPALADEAHVAEIVALRLAVILCHARADVRLPAWRLATGRTWVELGIDAGWLTHHPLTQHLLDEETAQWSKVGIRFTIKAL